MAITKVEMFNLHKYALKGLVGCQFDVRFTHKDKDGNEAYHLNHVVELNDYLYFERTDILSEQMMFGALQTILPSDLRSHKNDPMIDLVLLDWAAETSGSINLWHNFKMFHKSAFSEEELAELPEGECYIIDSAAFEVHLKNCLPINLQSELLAVLNDPGKLTEMIVQATQKANKSDEVNDEEETCEPDIVSAYGLFDGI